MEITGHLTRLNAGTLTLAFTEPASLKDMTMMWDGGEYLDEDVRPDLRRRSLGNPGKRPWKGIVDALDVACGGGGGARVTEEGRQDRGGFGQRAVRAPVRPGERQPSLAEGALPEPESGFLQFCRQDLLTIPAAGRPAPRFSLSRPLLDGLFGEAAAYSGRMARRSCAGGKTWYDKTSACRARRGGMGWTTGPSAFLIRGWAA